jgi:outer membrane protein assembly factor BamB
VVTVGNDETRAMDAADGRVVWKASGPTDYCVAGPAFGAGVVFVNGGYPDRRSLGFRVDGAGVSAREAAWESRKGTTYVPSPVFHEGHFYAVNDGGLATAWDAATGQVKWQQRLNGRYRASAVVANGLVYAVDDDGTTTVFKASPLRYEEVARNELGEFVYATPALAEGRVFIRARERLYAVGGCTRRAQAPPRAAAPTR